jgi:hypothetical protein
MQCLPRSQGEMQRRDAVRQVRAARRLMLEEERWQQWRVI